MCVYIVVERFGRGLVTNRTAHCVEKRGRSPMENPLESLELLWRGPGGCMGGRVCSERFCVWGARVRRGCKAGVWAPAWVRGGGACRWEVGEALCFMATATSTR